MDIRKEVKIISDQLGLDKEKTIGLSYLLGSTLQNLVKKQVANKNSELLFGDKPLYDVNSEEALIGMTIAFPEKSKSKTLNVTKDYFFDEKNSIIWSAIEFIRENDYEVSPSLIKTYVRQLGKEDLITDAFIDSLSVGYSKFEHINQYVQLVANNYQMRTLISVCQGTIEKTFSSTPSEIMSLKSKVLDSIENIRDVSEANKFDTVNDMIDSEKERMSKQRARLATGDNLLGFSTGLDELDRMLSGLVPGQVYVIAGRPAMGKSALALKILWYLVNTGVPTAFFSLEMPTSQVIGRCWSLEYNRSSWDWKLGKVSKEEEAEFYSLLGGLQLYVDDSAGTCIDDFEARATYLVKEKGVKALLIDYLQLMSGYRGKKYGSNREQEVADISKKLKEISKNLGVPIIELSQLSRAPEKRGGSKRPILSDIRDSGSVEQDADVVMFVHRPEYYDIVEDADGNSLVGVGEIIIAKHRDGATGTIKCSYNAEYAKWGNLEDIDFDEYINDSVENSKNDFFANLGRKTHDEVYNSDEGW